MRTRVDLTSTPSSSAATTTAACSAAASNPSSTMIKKEEKGHRLGNFHNYYTFNPSSNRISILNNLKIIEYLRKQLVIDDGDDNGDFNAKNDDDKLVGVERESKRLKMVSKSATDGMKKRRNITYCDLGCNEGDLTISISKQLVDDNSNSNTNNNTIMNCLGLDIDPLLINRANDKYNKDKSSNCIKKNNGNGDNVDDNDNDNSSTCNDNKFDTFKDIHIENQQINPTFQTCNIANNDEFKTICQSYLQSITIDKHPEKEELQQQQPQERKFDIISIFSTTMWIHIHHGDEGLKALLQAICKLSNQYVLIEPQPSKCYRNVNTRLRKMNFEQIDVSVERLKMRKDIEKETEDVILNCGFERVVLFSKQDHPQKDSQDGGDDDDKKQEKDLAVTGMSKGNNTDQSDRTKWNRTLRLYKRIN